MWTTIIKKASCEAMGVAEPIWPSTESQKLPLSSYSMRGEPLDDNKTHHPKNMTV